MSREPITLEILEGPDYQRDEDGWENNAYTVRLRCGGRFMDTEWHQGLGITDDPTAESVLENMLASGSERRRLPPPTVRQFPPRRYAF
jgi:hypothetical protein